ncbi:MAG: hypothetical protein EOO10_20330 [Chitinophagaceae bacterium]|nr:MAG: hypothetical protein EOO10_20330 [Chitinophagaceae bacterium]
MKKPAYKNGEKITWYLGGNPDSGVDLGIIKESGRWAVSFHYLMEDKEPHCWVLEEWIVGWEDRRHLRDKLDNAAPLK